MNGTLRLPAGSFIEDEAVRRLFAALDGRGETLRAVGGAVRNALMGRPIGDVDFATTAIPSVVAARAQAAGLKSVPTGIEHGTLTLLAQGRTFEVTTLRADVETDGRHAKVVFGRDFAADAARRDFTMNALYADGDGAVHDPLGGLADLLARRVRFIGDAQTRLREDALRILRFFRFSAQYSDEPADPEGLMACVRERSGLDRLSRERIRQETLRLLVAPQAAPMIDAMSESGLSLAVLKGVSYGPAFSRLAAIESSLGLAPDPMLRLATLAARVAEDCERLSAALRLSRAEMNLMTALVRLAPLLPAGSPEEKAEAFLFKKRTEPVAQAVLFGWALSGAAADDPSWRALQAKSIDWRRPEPPFKGEDLLKLGLKPGPNLGAALAALEDWWITARFPADPARLSEAMRRVVENARAR